MPQIYESRNRFLVFPPAVACPEIPSPPAENELIYRSAWRGLDFAFDSILKNATPPVNLSVPSGFDTREPNKTRQVFAVDAQLSAEHLADMPVVKFYETDGSLAMYLAFGETGISVTSAYEVCTIFHFF